MSPSARGVNPCVPLGLASHLGPVRHEWLYHIAPRIIDTQALPRRQRGDTVGRGSMSVYVLLVALCKKYI